MNEQSADTGFLKAAQSFAICASALAVLTGMLLMCTASLSCFDGCDPASWIGAEQAQEVVRLFIPYWIIEAVAIWLFWMYCVGANQVKRAVKASLIIATCGVVGVALLYGFILTEQFELPAINTAINPDYESLFAKMAGAWAFGVLAVIFVWSAIIARLIWPSGVASAATTSPAPGASTTKSDSIS
jgi:hypothetical protein